MRLALFGPGFAGSRILALARAHGIATTPITRATPADAIAAAIAAATHIISTVAPEGEDDAVLRLWRPRLEGRWLGYLSSTGVYGDTDGAWVDESAPLRGRRGGRITADGAWLALGARVFRLPGIYGPGRSALDRVAAGTAHRIDWPGQLFSRIHVDDIATAVLRAMRVDAPAGAYNLADDDPCAQNRVVEEACRMLGKPPPPLLAPDDPALSPAARAFYRERRRIASGRARRVIGWSPRYPDHRAGLRAILRGR